MSQKMMFLFAAILMAINAFVCLAQVEQGAIAGAVVDSTGASIPNATVTAKNQATGTIAKTETTPEGYYKLPYLPAGKYSLAVEKDGFTVNRVTDVPVLVGQIATINITLKPGSLHEEITIKSNAVLIDQVSASLGYVASSTQIIELPTNRPSTTRILLRRRPLGKSDLLPITSRPSMAAPPAAFWLPLADPAATNCTEASTIISKTTS